MNSKINKKGILGSLFVMVIATIAIVLILGIFILGSGLVKKFDKVDAGVSIYDENRTGLDDVFSYITSYQKFVEAKYLVAGGSKLDSALVEVGYGE